MPLCQPNVVGPLSELNTLIRVQGHFPGAKVTVFSIKPVLHKVAEGTATSSDERFSLIGGVHLSSKDLLVAVQEINGEKSDVPSGDLEIGVQPKPQSAADIGTVGFVTHLFECGQFIWIGGVIPGAKVEIFSTHLLGSGTAVEGYARFALTEALPHGNVLVHAHQIVPALPNGPDITHAPDVIPPLPNREMPTPTMIPPLRGCDFSVDVSGVVDGALVTIRHDNGPTVSAGFDLDHLRWNLQSPLKQGELLSIKQEVAKSCERKPVWSAPVKVGPLKPVDPPVVKGPLCAGGTRVRVEQLRPGAIVHIAANGKIFDGQAPPDRTWFDFTVPPLTGATVSATQEACGVSSMPSVPVNIDPHQAKIPAPTVVAPLFACARTVSVDNVHAGATVQIMAVHGGVTAPISDAVAVYDTHATIGVSPYLRKDDDVFVAQWACSDTRANSASKKVNPHPTVNPVAVVDPIFSGDTIAEVTGALAGALVEMFVLRSGGTVFAGSAIGDALSFATTVHANFPFAVGDVVLAKQTLCDITSEPGMRVVVAAAPRFGPRPFYVIGHNPNTIAEVTAALDAGANAIEPDVNVFEDQQDQLCISHSEGEPGAPSLNQFLQDLHTVALQRPGLALIRFDCKPKVATAQHGVTLLNAIRSLLTFDTKVNIIISVGSLSETAIFDSIRAGLLPREGLMVDEENDPIAVSDFFASDGVTNQSFGNGISVLNGILGPNVRPSMERACEFRAATNRTKYIDVWTVQDDDLLRRYINIGVDGIITDTIPKLRNIMDEAGINNLIRLATRQDNPLRPANFAYGLEIHTGDVWMAGTDALVTFTLTGPNGTSSISVDTKPPYRMERNDWNFVTLQSPDLGALQSITVQRDDSGNGPDWFLDRIRVNSFRFGVSKEAIFNRWIDTTSPFTQPLV